MLQKDLVIEFDKAIADSPHLGIEDMRNLNITSDPGAVSLNFKTSALTAPPTVSALAFTAATSDVFTVSSTSGWYNGMAVVLNSVVTAVGISTGRVYWIGDLTSTTFKLYKGPSLNALILADVTTAGSGTLSSYTLGPIIDKASYITPQAIGSGVVSSSVFLLDSNGKAWGVGNFSGAVTNNLIFLGNDNATTGNGKAIIVFGSNLIVFTSGYIDTLNLSTLFKDFDLDSGSGWQYNANTVSDNLKATRAVFVGQDNVLYFDNSDGLLGSFTAAMTKNSAALDLPSNEDIISLGELGTNLLIGGIHNLVYPWDRISSSFNFPIPVPENNIAKIVSVNNLAYLFAGNRGRIYITNGTSVEPYKKIPDHISGVNDPYFVWNDAIGHRNQLFVSFTASQNDGTALNNTGGVWAIDLKSGAFRYTNQLSYGAYTGSATVLIPNVLSSTPPGNGLYVGWTNSSTYGVDVGSTSYYTSYAAYFISPIYRVGTHKNKNDIQEFEFVLEKSLATGEGVRVSWRKNRSASWSSPVTFDYSTYPSEQTVMLPLIANELVTVQFKVEVTGSTTTPVLQGINIR